MALAGQEARVAADRVNLRARPLEDAEVAGQASQGDSLVILRQEEDWAAVQAPAHVTVGTDEVGAGFARQLQYASPVRRCRLYSAQQIMLHDQSG